MLVYIREAHPDSVLLTVRDGKEALEKIGQTDTAAARAANAKACVETLKLSVPAVIDAADNRVNAAYAGWPDRLYVVGVDGAVAYKGGVGPGGFRPAEVEELLKTNTK